MSSSISAYGVLRLRNLQDGRVMCEDINDDTVFFINYDIIQFFFSGLTNQQVKDVQYQLENISDVIVNCQSWKIFKPKSSTKSFNILELPTQEDTSLNSTMVGLSDSVSELATDYMNNHSNIKSLVEI